MPDRVQPAFRRSGYRRWAGGVLAAALLAPAVTAQPVCAPADEAVCQAVFRAASTQAWDTRPFGETVVAVGSRFLGVPYVAKALELPGAERLVVNLTGLDCTTFVESTLALARAIKAKEATVTGFQRQLQQIRYRDGRINGYPSRLHYFSDWIHEGAKRGLVRDVTWSLGGIPYAKPVDFMSRHANLYAQLADPAHLRATQAIEQAISQRSLHHLTGAALAAAKIEPGDVVAFTTPVPGLDVSHVGLAVRHDGRMHLLNAPNVGKTVEISARPLTELVGKAGVMVARPLAPVPTPAKER